MNFIDALNRHAFEYNLVNLKDLQTREFSDFAVVILPTVFNFRLLNSVLELKKSVKVLCFISYNSVVWLRPLANLNFSDLVFNYKDFKTFLAFYNANHFPIVLNQEAFEVSFESSTVQLTKQEFSLVKYLYSRYGQSVARSEIMQNVWSYSDKVLSKTLDATIFNIRRKFKGAFFPKLVHTIYSRGYKFLLNDN